MCDSTGTRGPVGATLNGVPDSPYLQRAELLADLGQYEDAASELAEAASVDAPAQVLRARLYLATGELKAALAAAEAAVAASSTDVTALATRGTVLAELGRVDEAAQMAERILRHGRGDGYASTSAAAILAEARVGQLALDAAWEGVRLTPEQPRAHLVLGVVAARLGLTDVAVRAYQEALALAPQLADDDHALGLVRQELYHYAMILERYAEAGGAGSDGPGRADRRRRPVNGWSPQGPGAGAQDAGAGAEDPYGTPWADDVDDDADDAYGGYTGYGREPGAAELGMAGYPEVPELPGQPDADGEDPDDPTGAGRLHQLLRYGSAYAVLAPLGAVWADATDTAAPLVALLLASLGAVGMVAGFRRLPEEAQAALPEAMGSDRALTVTVWSVATVPTLLVLYTLWQSPWTLALAVAVGILALFANRSRRPLP